MKYMKKIVALCITSILLYTLVAILFQVFTGMELSVMLTDRFLTVMGVELGATAFIKIGEAYAEKLRVKLEKENKEDINNESFTGI